MFQSSAFQSNAFQIAGSSGVILLGGGPGEDQHVYHKYTSYSELRERALRKSLEERNAELRHVEKEIKQKEQRRLIALQRSKAKLAEKDAAFRQAILEATLQDEINKLRMGRAWLMRMINDEETILVLLLSWPLH